MANHKSAVKRAKQNETRRLRNNTIKTRVKTAIKAVMNSESADAATNLDKAKSIIAKAAKKGTIHKKTAARKISRLTKEVNKISA